MNCIGSLQYPKVLAQLIETRQQDDVLRSDNKFLCGVVHSQYDAIDTLTKQLDDCVLSLGNLDDRVHLHAQQQIPVPDPVAVPDPPLPSSDQ